MKKKLLALLVITTMLISLIAGGISASAKVSLEECDKCFQTTMSAILDREDVENNKILATRKAVYDIKLEQLGYIYEFNTVYGGGYAIIICDDGNYVAIEVFPAAESPYTEVGEEEQNVFINTMSYYKAVDGEICDIATGKVVPDEAYSALEENAILYIGSGTENPERVSVTVEYQSVDEDYYKMSYITPQFANPGLDGGCAAVAGGNIIGYFDRFYEDLIPNHEAGELISGYYVYNFADSYVYEAMRTLYADMNGTENGINETNFKSGLQKYCARKGLSCSFTSLKSGGKLNYDSVKSSMQSDKPVALLLSTYNTCEISFGNNKDYLDYELYPGNHVMVGFGYRDITYTLTTGSKSNYKFIYVSTGFVTPLDAYFNINYSTNIVSAYGVNIY